MSTKRKVSALEVTSLAENAVEKELHKETTTIHDVSNLGKLSALLASNVSQRFGKDDETGAPVAYPMEKLNAMVSDTLFDDGSETDVDTYASIENVYRSNVVYDLVDWFYDNSEKFSDADKKTSYAKAGEFFTLENPLTGAESVDWESDTGRGIVSAALLGLSETDTPLALAWLSMATTEVVEGGDNITLASMLTSLFVHDINTGGEISEVTGSDVFDALKDTLNRLTRSRDFDWRSDMMRESSRTLSREIMEAKRNYRDFIRAYENAESAHEVRLGDFFKNHNKGSELLLSVVAAYTFYKTTEMFENHTLESFIEEVLTTIVAPGKDSGFAAATVAASVWLAETEKVSLTD